MEQRWMRAGYVIQTQGATSRKLCFGFQAVNKAVK